MTSRLRVRLFSLIVSFSLAVLPWLMPISSPSRAFAATCPTYPTGTAFTTSDTKVVTEFWAPAPLDVVGQLDHKFLVYLENRGVVYEQNVPGEPGSKASNDALEMAKSTVRAQYPNVIFSNPMVLRTDRVQVNSTPTSKVTGIKQTVTMETVKGPATIFIGENRGTACLVPPNCTNINTNTHTETTVEVTPGPTTFLTTTVIGVNGILPVRPMIPQLQQLPYLGALFTNHSRNKQKTPLVIFVTPKIIIQGEEE